MAFGNKEIRSDGAIKNRISISLNFPVAFTEMLLTLASFDLFWLLCLQHYPDLHDLHFMTDASSVTLQAEISWSPCVPAGE